MSQAWPATAFLSGAGRTCWGYYFTAPAVMPWESLRWKMTKKMMVGMILSSDADARVVASIVCCPWSVARASGMVCTSSPIRNVIGIMYSFHVQTKKNTNSTLIVCQEIGSTTLSSTCQRESPSMDATSRMACGNVPYTEESR